MLIIIWRNIINCSFSDGLILEEGAKFCVWHFRGLFSDSGGGGCLLANIFYYYFIFLKITFYGIITFMLRVSFYSSKRQRGCTIWCVTVEMSLRSGLKSCRKWMCKEYSVNAAVATAGNVSVFNHQNEGNATWINCQETDKGQLKIICIEWTLSCQLTENFAIS